MKRLASFVFCTMVICSANAENWIVFPSHAVEDAVNTMVAPENRQNVADEYETQMNPDNGQISTSGIYSVCAAAGWNISNSDGYYMCRGFVDKIAELSDMSGGASRICAQNNGILMVTPDGNGYECIGRDGKPLVYARACRGADGECVRVFKNLRTQVPNAKAFIYQYGELTNTIFTCSNEIVEINTIGSDYIKCSAGGKAYEFEFDTLNQSYNQRMVDSENAMMCEMFGGTESGGDEYWYNCDLMSSQCDKLSDFANEIGHHAMYQGYCRLGADVNMESTVFLNHIDGVDSYAFYNVSIRSGIAKPIVEQYLKSIFPNESGIICEPDIVELNDPTSLDTNWIMQCTVGTQQVDFVFDDLSESLEMAAGAGLEEMQCIINGGNYDGKFCRWLNQDDCNALNNEFENIARWDEKAGACVMSDSAKYEAFKNGVMAIGGTVVGVAVTVASGGSALVVFAIVATDVVFEGAFALFQRLQETNPQHRAVQFIKETKDCHDSTCASKAITNHFVRLDEIMDNLSTDMQNAIMDHFEYLSSLLTEEEFNNAMNASGLKFEDYVYNTSGITLAMAALFVNPDQAIVKGMARAPKIAGRLARWANKFLSKANKFKLMNVVKEVEGVNVYKMLNLETGYASYLKYTDIDELNYTLKASNFKPSSNKPILHMVSVNTTNQKDLANIVKANNLQPKKADQVYLMTNEVPDGTTPFLLKEGVGTHFLNGKGITKSEADQLIREIGEMNDAGIYHGDINSNIFISRDASGNLQAYLIDFQAWSREGRIDDVADIRDILYKAVSKGL